MKKQLMTRRDVLRKGCLLGMAASVAGVLPWSALAGQANEYTQQTRMLMGTFVTVSVAHASQLHAEEAMEKAFAEVERLVSIFDRHSSSSVLGHLNQHGTVKDAPKELRAVLGQAIELNARAEGIFNPAIAPLLALFEKHAQPDAYTASVNPQELQDMLELADVRAIGMHANTISLQRSGMRLSLDGIAKGAIVDAAATCLQQEGINNFLVNAGGDMFASGLNEQGKLWQVGIENPQRKGAYLAVVPLSNQAIATSGGYESKFDASGRANHLLNPFTGKSSDVVSVTVVAPRAGIADALATSLALLPPAQGISLAESYGAKSFMVAQGSAVYRSKSWLLS